MPGKVAVILGSPRKNGNSEQLASAFSKGAAEAGYETRIVRMQGKKVGGCMDCRRCWTDGTHCVVKDDMASVYEALDTSDVFVFATPLYFYSWPTQIKPVWDRLIPYYMPNSKVDIKGRRAVLLATAGDTTPECFDGLKKSFELACSYCKWEIAGTLCAFDVYTPGEIAQKGNWLKEAETLGKSL